MPVIGSTSSNDLEACRTSDLSDQPVFGSVAPALLESGVGSVVAFSHSIHIEASKILVERFYHELADGLSVGQALAEARVQMRTNPYRWLRLGPNPPTVKLQDWFVPQLYQVSQDLSLVGEDVDLGKADGGAEPVLTKSWREGLHGFPPDPTYTFQGGPWSSWSWAGRSRSTTRSYWRAWEAWARRPCRARPRPGGFASGASRRRSFAASSRCGASTARCR